MRRTAHGIPLAILVSVASACASGIDDPSPDEGVVGSEGTLSTDVDSVVGQVDDTPIESDNPSRAWAEPCVDVLFKQNPLVKTYTVINHCSSTIAVRIDLQFHADIGCSTIFSNGNLIFTVPATATLRDVIPC
jgi:hypothetical protein